MKIRARVHGKDTLESIKKDYPRKTAKESVKALLGEALMSLFSKKKEKE